MNIRPAIAFLLLVSMTVTTVGRAPARADDLPVETDNTRLTFDEELEARSLAEQFIKRFEESDDLLSIVDDFYVRDFGDRLRRNPAERFIVPIDSRLAGQVEGDELRRYHMAMLKFTYLYMMLLAGAWYQSADRLNGNKKLDDDESVVRPKDALPPRALALIGGDPALAEMLLEESENAEASKKTTETDAVSDEQAIVADQDSGSRAEERDKDLTIKTIERLRGFISTVEQAVSIMREHLRSLPVPQTWQSIMGSISEPGQEIGSDQMTASVTLLAQQDFGCPKGTRLISLKVMPFSMELIRVDGQLRILNVYVYAD